MKRRIRYLTLLIAALLYLGNPSEHKFLQQVSADYGSMHGGMRIGVEDLLEMGESTYDSYVLFSLYDYRFGTIETSYLGVGFFTFYLGSKTTKPEHTFTT